MNLMDSIVRKLQPLETSAAPFAGELLTSNQSTIFERYAAVANQLAGYAIGKPKWPARNPNTYARDGYSKLALIYRCVNFIAYSAGTAPLRVFDDTTEADLSNSPLANLMRRPNPRQGQTGFVGTIATRAMVSGFCVVEKERNRLGQVIALWPLQSSWLKAIPRTDSAHDWEYIIPGVAETYILKAEDVIPFRWAETYDGSAYGLGVLEACVREIALSNTMLDFLKLYFDRGAVPLHGLIPDTQPGETLDQSEVDEMLGLFLQRHGGLERSTVPMIMQGIKSIVRMGVNMNELAYESLHDLAELGIVQAFGIPASVAQIRVGLEHSDSRANAQVDEGKFYRGTMVPFWTRLDEALTINLLADFAASETMQIEFDTSDVEALQEDRNELHERVRADYTAGEITLNESRIETGRSSIGPAGDVYRVLFNTAFITAEELLTMNRQGPLFAPVVREGQTVNDAQKQLAASLRREMLRSDSTDESIAEALSHTWIDEAIDDVLGDVDNSYPHNLFIHNPNIIVDNSKLNGNGSMLALAERTKGAGPRERRAAAGDRDKALIGKVAEKRAPAILAFLNAQASRIIPKVIADLNAGRIPDETFSISDVNWKRENELLKKEMKKLHMLAGQTSWGAMPANHGVDVGLSFSLQNPNVKRVIDKLGHKVVRITDETKAAIQLHVTRGIDAGMKSDAIAAELDTFVEQTYKGRSLAIARTESMFAYGEANILGFKESGIVAEAQIFDNPDHEDDYGAADGLTCATRDGIFVSLDDAMSHIYADHTNGSAVATPVIEGDK